MKQNTYILNLETTTKNCSVGLSLNGKLLALKELNDGNYSHAEFLNPFIEEVLKEANVDFSVLSAVAISKGPGSYTGLRIGVSTAKGLCYALDIPLIAVNTLKVLARKVSVESGVIIPMLDARRMEVYQAVFSSQFEELELTDAVIITPDTYHSWLEVDLVHFVGDAVPKCRQTIQHPNAVFHENTFPSAREMSEMSYQKFTEKNFENLAYFEPYYLKDFIAVKKV